MLSIGQKIVIAALICLLSSCASQEAFKNGKGLLEIGKPEEGLVQIKNAINEQPNNLEYRAYYYRQREVWVSKLLAEADSLRNSRRWDDAQTRYKRVLLIDTDSQRAQDGLAQIDAGKRRESELKKAVMLIETDEVDAAKEKIRIMLAEDNTNAEAKALLRSIEQKRATVTSTSRLSAKFRKTVSLELKDAGLKTVFEMLSKSAGINFTLDRDLRSDIKVNIYVKQTTIEAALQHILSTTQLGKKILNEDSVLIYPISKKSDYEEMMVRTFYLNNVDSKDVMSLIKTVVKTKDIFIDEKLNILVMRDTSDAVKLAEKLIAGYDLGDPEVLLEAEVLEISSSKLKELGIRYPNQISIGANGTPGAGQLSFNDVKRFTSDMGIITFNDPALVLSLRATDSGSNLLANPRIRVKNHKKAKIHIGDRVPVITTTSTSTGFASESVNYLDVGLKLDVEPSVMVSDEVTIDIGLEVSNIVSEVASKNGTLTYRLGTRNANTTLRLKNGETQMLAGLINDQEQTVSNKVPGISNLPIIGRLFSSNKDTKDKTEIVLLITPRIIRNIVPPDASVVEFSTGTETGNTSAFLSTSLHEQTIQPEVLQPVPLEGFSIAPQQQPVVETQTDISLIPPPPPLPNAVSPVGQESQRE